MVSLPDEVIAELKCIKCKNYLSYLPVYEHKETGAAICGRCSSPNCGDGDKYQRNALYERLAKHIKFPCQFKNEGCKETVYPNEVRDHEGSCIFKLLNCPLEKVEECSWNGCHFQLADHYKESHKELVIENNKVELDFSKDFNTKYLLINNEACEDKLFDKIFIADMICVHRRFNCVVYYFGPRRLEVLSFTLVLNSNDFDFPEVMALYCCSYHYRNKIAPGIIPFKTSCVVGTFNIFQSYSIVKNSTLSCFFCSKYKGEEILSCKKGHSVCEDCKTNHSEKCDFTDLSVNEKLIQKVVELKFDCRNRKKGCRFVCKNEEALQTHLKVCVFDDSVVNVKCSKCHNTSPDYRALLAHSKQSCLNIFDDNTVNRWDLTQELNHKAYKMYDNYIFLIRCWFEHNELLNITVNLLHQQEVSCNYDYEIQFVHPSSSKAPFLVARRYLGCPVWVIKRQTVENFITDNVVYYKLKILRK